MGVHAPTQTLTRQNPYLPTKGTGCSHGSKGLNLQWVNPRDELDKTYYYSYIVTMTQLCNGASGWMNTMGGTSSPSSLSVRAPAGWPSCRPHLSHGLLLPSSSPSVLAATQVVVIVCPVARHRRLSHCHSIAIAIAVYPCASYPSHCRCHRRLSCGSSLASAHGSGHHRSLPLWLVVVIVVAMVGGDSWDWCWRWWRWLISGSICAFVMAGSPSS